MSFLPRLSVPFGIGSRPIFAPNCRKKSFLSGINRVRHYCTFVQLTIFHKHTATNHNEFTAVSSLNVFHDRQRGRPHGYRFKAVTGGFTSVFYHRRMPCRLLLSWTLDLYNSETTVLKRTEVQTNRRKKPDTAYRRGLHLKSNLFLFPVKSGGFGG